MDPATHAARPFDLLAALDLLDGRVVRLRQGDYDDATVYDEDPVRFAEHLVVQGARWLHVVDLEGARAGESRQGSVIEAIARALSGRAHVEVGGGVRTRARAEDLFRLGVTRVVLGTAAIRDPDMVAALVTAYGTGRVAVAVDVRDGVAMAQGWEETARQTSREVLGRLIEAGARIFEVTAIDRDGTMSGPDLNLLRDAVALAAPSGSRVVASGGIRDVDDLVAVRSIGCVGAIVGKALYEGHVMIADALARTGG